MYFKSVRNDVLPVFPTPVRAAKVPVQSLFWYSAVIQSYHMPEPSCFFFDYLSQLRQFCSFSDFNTAHFVMPLYSKQFLEKFILCYTKQL